MQDSHKIARAVLRAARVKPAAFLVGEAADVIAAALEEARREERGRIKAAALAIRADYPEALFPTLPAAAGARLAIDRLLEVLS